MPPSARAPRAAPGAPWRDKSPASVVLTRTAAGGLEQEPGPPLCFVDPHFDEARGRDVAVVVAHVMDLAQRRRQAPVVVAQLGQHVLRVDIVGVVVENALAPRNVADRA